MPGKARYDGWIAAMAQIQIAGNAQIRTSGSLSAQSVGHLLHDPVLGILPARSGQ
jgi:hypothetical protein